MDAIQVYASKAMAMTQVDEFWTILAPLAYVAIVPFLNVLIAMAYECWKHKGTKREQKIVKKYGLTPLQPEPGKKYVGVTSLKDVEAPAPKKVSPAKDGVAAPAPKKVSPAKDGVAAHAPGKSPAAKSGSASKAPPKKK